MIIQDLAERRGWRWLPETRQFAGPLMYRDGTKGGIMLLSIQKWDWTYAATPDWDWLATELARQGVPLLEDNSK